MTSVTRVPRQIEDWIDRHSATSRRDFLKTSGMLVVSLGAAGLAGPLAAAAEAGGQTPAPGAGPYPDVDFRRLDSWIAVHEDNTATFYVGKTDGGQGTGTALRQMMASELDMPFDRTSLVMGRTDITVDQGGSGSSDAIQVDGWPARRVAAEARRVLLDLASQRLGVPVDRLAASDGAIAVQSDPSRKLTYGELVGGRRFNVMLTGDNVNATTGVASVKPVQDLKYVGQPLQRYDIPPKVDGSLKWAAGARVPGMVHARNVRPPVAGAKLVSIDESSVRDIPGFVKVISKGNYVAVVCEREEHAIQAARQLRVKWQKPAPPFPTSDGVYDYIRNATPTSSGDPVIVGDPDAALASAARVVKAEYEFPFQGHTAIGPAHAMADPSDGQLTIYTNDMKAYGMRESVAQFLDMPADRVRVIWMDGPQLYGRTAADDAGFEAAFLAKEIGRPVRVQWMRHEETAWDTKGPAYVIRMAGGLDADGRLTALDYDARCIDYYHLGYNEPDTVLIAQLMGVRRNPPPPGRAATPSEMYEIANRRQTTHVVKLPLECESPLRTGNLRDPNGPQVHFASESFIDELAAAAKADPVAFRLDLLRAASRDDKQFKRARSIAVVEAAAETFGWDARPSPRAAGAGRILTGRGIAYCYRNQTVLATVAEVEVDRQTGRVWTKRLVCAHDCGLVINPVGLERTVEGNLLYGLSRVLHEEVRFDREKVTSVDWRTHPTLTHADAPERIDVVIVNGDPNPARPDLPHYGAGEAGCRSVAAAVANAVFDATGVRIRRVPFRPERVLAALNAAGV